MELSTRRFAELIPPLSLASARSGAVPWFRALFAAAAVWLAFIDLFGGIQSIPHKTMDALNTSSEYAAMIGIYRGNPRIWRGLDARDDEYLGVEKAVMPIRESRVDYNFLFSYLWALADWAMNIGSNDATPTHSIWTGRLVLGLFEVFAAASMALFLAKRVGLHGIVAALAGLLFLYSPISLNLGKIVSNTPFGSAFVIPFSVFFALVFDRGFLTGGRSHWKLWLVSFLVGWIGMLTDYFMWMSLAAIAVVLAATALARKDDRKRLMGVFVAVHLAVGAGLLVIAAHYQYVLRSSWLGYLFGEYGRHPYDSFGTRMWKGVQFLGGHVKSPPFMMPGLLALAALATLATALISARRAASRGANPSLRPDRPDLAALLRFQGFTLFPVVLFYLLFSREMAGGPERNTALELVYLAVPLLLVASAGRWLRLSRLAAALPVAITLGAVLLHRLFVFNVPDHVRGMGHWLFQDMRICTEGYAETPVVGPAEVVRLAWNLSYGRSDLSLRYPSSLRSIEAGGKLMDPLLDPVNEHIRGPVHVVLGIWYPLNGKSRYLRRLRAGEPYDAVVTDPGAPREGLYVLRRQYADQEETFRVLVTRDGDRARVYRSYFFEGRRVFPGPFTRLLDPQRKVWWGYEPA